MARGDRRRVRWKHDRTKKKKERDKRKAREAREARKQSAS